MKTQYLSALIELNPNELTPWHSQIVSTPINPENQHLSSREPKTIAKSFLPKVIKHQSKSLQKQQKVQYQVATKQLLPDHKTFEIIKTAKETAFNGFITKYKVEPKNKNRRYLMVTKDELLNSSLHLPEKVKFINLSTFQSKDESEINDLSKSYQLKQFQFSRKRSLSNIIKSIGKNKFLKLKQPCLYSPWMLTNCISPEKRSIKDKDFEMAEKNMKLIELNLGIRQRNIMNNRAIKN